MFASPAICAGPASRCCMRSNGGAMGASGAPPSGGPIPIMPCSAAIMSGDIMSDVIMLGDAEPGDGADAWSGGIGAGAGGAAEPAVSAPPEGAAADVPAGAPAGAA